MKRSQSSGLRRLGDGSDDEIARTKQVENLESFELLASCGAATDHSSWRQPWVRTLKDQSRGAATEGSRGEPFSAAPSGARFFSAVFPRLTPWGRVFCPSVAETGPTQDSPFFSLSFDHARLPYQKTALLGY